MSTHFDPVQPQCFHTEYFRVRSERQRALGHAIRRCFLWTFTALAGLYESWSALLLHRHELHVLQTMDDRMLADIGIGRSEIPALVRGATRRRGGQCAP